MRNCTYLILHQNYPEQNVASRKAFAAMKDGPSFSCSLAMRLGSYVQDNAGGVMVMVAIAAPVMVGLAGLAVEGGYAYAQHVKMQSVADVAALSAAQALTRDGANANAAREANGVAAQLGYLNNTNSVTVTVNSPPSSGTYPNASVEVIVSRLQKPILMSLFRNSSYTIAGHSIAIAGSYGDGCILALDPASSDTGISVGGSPVINMPNCAAYSNSPASASSYIGGAASVAVQALYTVGGLNGALAAGTLHSGVGPMADPYAGKFATPTNSGNTCTFGRGDKMPVDGTLVTPPSAGPAYICYSVNLNAGDILKLAPGTYIFDGSKNGAIKGVGQSSLIGAGVTLVFINGANISLSGGSTTTISAPTASSTAGPYTPYPGLAIWQPAANSSAAQIAGGSGQSIKGAIYTPTAYVSYSGSTALGGAGCTEIIAYQIAFSGNSQVDNTGCGSAGVAGFGYQAPSLVD